MKRLVAFAAAFLLATPFATAGDLPKPLTDDDFRIYPQAQVKLGRLLFYDRILSGTYRVSCATCHNHDRASSNGARLDGKEEERDDLAVGGEPVYEPFKPSAKHAPPLFNLGAKQFTRMFFDGRVERLPDGSFRSPAGDDLPEGLNDVLAVQALFPAVNRLEMVGVVESEIVTAFHQGNTAVWDALAARVRSTEEYWPRFKKAFPELESADGITIVHIANAIGTFVGTEWRSDNAPFDRYLRGDKTSLSEQQKRGMDLFYGKAKCDVCHSGALQTDHKLHRLTLPVHGDPLEALTESGSFPFRRRTPSLRNVSRTPPYGHDGSFADLKWLLRFHLSSENDATRAGKFRLDEELTELDIEIRLPSDMPDIEPLNDGDLSDLIAFLKSLTDEKGLRGKLGKPAEVPSSLALD